MELASAGRLSRMKEIFVDATPVETRCLPPDAELWAVLPDLMALF